MTYEDPTLVGTVVSGTAYRDHKIARGAVRVHQDPVQSFPVSWGSSRYKTWDYGFVEPKYPELKVLAYTDAHPLSHVGMFSEKFGTPEPGWYLDTHK